MADEMDISVSYQEAHLARSLEEHRAGQPHGDSLHTCITCGDEIPEARRLAVPGCRRCVYCQSRLERM